MTPLGTPGTMTFFCHLITKKTRCRLWVSLPTKARLKIISGSCLQSCFACYSQLSSSCTKSIKNQAETDNSCILPILNEKHFYACRSLCNPEQKNNLRNSNVLYYSINYRKIPRISPKANIFQRPFLRGLSTEGNLRFKIDWASLIVGRKFTVFTLFCFVFEGNFQVQAPGGLIFGGAI